MPEPAIDPTELERLRAQYGELQKPCASCPDPEELAGLLDDELDPDERTKLADRVVQCPRCAESYRLLLELDEAAPDRRKPAASHRRWLLAAVLLVVALGLAFFLPRPLQQGSEPPVPLRGAELHVAPPDGARLTALPRSFGWPPQAQASSYQVLLHDAEGEVVWQGTSSTASLDLPGELAADLPPGAYYWVVETVGGAAPPRLGPYWFELLAPAE